MRREVAVPFLSGRFGRGRVKTEAAPLVPFGWGGRTATEPALAYGELPLVPFWRTFGMKEVPN